MRGQGAGGRRGTGDDGVSAVLGAVLVMAITVAGIFAVLFWGAPLLQSLQDRSAMAGMTAEFEEVRDSQVRLSGIDSTRNPGIAMPGGELSLVEGTSVLVAANHDATFTACDFHVTAWSDGDASVQLTAAAQFPTCRTALSTAPPLFTCTITIPAQQACLEAYAVDGTVLTEVGATVGLGGAVTLGQALAGSDFLLRLTDGASDPAVYAEAWLLRQDRLAWSWETSESDLRLDLEGGALFSVQDGAVFVEAQPPVAENAFGSGDDFLLRLPVLDATSGSGFVGKGSHSLFLSLASSLRRVEVDDARLLRFDFAGDGAEAWCNTLLARNDALASPAPYAEDAGMTCAAGDGQGVRSVTYSLATDFPFELVHARIQATLQL